MAGVQRSNGAPDSTGRPSLSRTAFAVDAESARRQLCGWGRRHCPDPTELFLASVAGCVTFCAERFLRWHSLQTDGLAVACDWNWAREPVRVGEIEINVEANLYEAFSSRVIEHCPIHNTLTHPFAVRFRVASTRTVKAA